MSPREELSRPAAVAIPIPPAMRASSANAGANCSSAVRALAEPVEGPTYAARVTSCRGPGSSGPLGAARFMSGLIAVCSMRLITNPGTSPTTTYGPISQGSPGVAQSAPSARTQKATSPTARATPVVRSWRD